MSGGRLRTLAALPALVARRLGLYALNVLVVTAVGIFTIPVLVGAVGPQRWAHFALMQTLAQVGLILVMYGWGVVGPSLVAAAPQSRRSIIFRESLLVRGILYAVMVPVVALAGIVLMGGDVALACVSAVALLLPGLSAGWFFVGQARPDRLLLLDSLPMVLLSIVGLVLAASLRSIWPFIGFLGLGYATAALVSTVVLLRGHPDEHQERQSVLQRFVGAIRSQRHAVTATIVNTAYVSAPMLVVQVLMPASLPVYALMDRLYRYGSIGYGPIQQYLQGWIPRSDGDEAGRARRMRAAAGAAAGIGLTGTLVLTTLGPVIAHRFSHGQIRVSTWELLPLGVAFAAVCVSTTVGYACLAPLGKVRVVAISTLVGALIGLPLIIGAAAMLKDVAAVAWALAVSEIAVAAVQSVVLARSIRGIGRPA